MPFPPTDEQLEDAARVAAGLPRQEYVGPREELAQRKGRPVGEPWCQIAPGVWVPEVGPVSITKQNQTLQQMAEGEESFMVHVRCKSLGEAQAMAEMAVDFMRGE